MSIYRSVIKNNIYPSVNTNVVDMQKKMTVSEMLQAAREADSKKSVNGEKIQTVDQVKQIGSYLLVQFCEGSSLSKCKLNRILLYKNIPHLDLSTFDLDSFRNKYKPIAEFLNSWADAVELISATAKMHEISNFATQVLE